MCVNEHSLHSAIKEKKGELDRLQSEFDNERLRIRDLEREIGQLKGHQTALENELANQKTLNLESKNECERLRTDYINVYAKLFIFLLILFYFILFFFFNFFLFIYFLKMKMGCYIIVIGYR